MNEKTIGNLFKGDKVIWMVFFFLCIISIVEVFSASSTLTYKGANYLSPIIKHAGILLAGLIAMILTLNIPCNKFSRFTILTLFIAYATQGWVLVAGEVTNGAQRWVEFLGIQFQPSEIAKGAIVLMTAQILSQMQEEKGASPKALLYIAAFCGPLILIIGIENLSTAALLSFIVFLMLFLGRIPKNQLMKILGGSMLAVILALSLVLLVGHEKKEVSPTANQTEKITGEEEKEEEEGIFSSIFHRADTWKSRILKFTRDEYVAPQDFDLDKDGQVGHANIAIASSNVIGRGPGNSVARDFLSQAFSDFIYAIIIEEMGIFGAFFVAMLYIILLFRTGMIANKCESLFPALLAMGIALLLVTQALFNMCVAVGLVPVTGQPLPLISKGGTSTIINCVYMGVVLSVSRSIKKKKDSKEQLALQ